MATKGGLPGSLPAYMNRRALCSGPITGPYASICFGPGAKTTGIAGTHEPFGVMRLPPDIRVYAVSWYARAVTGNPEMIVAWSNDPSVSKSVDHVGLNDAAVTPVIAGNVTGVDLGTTPSGIWTGDSGLLQPEVPLDSLGAPMDWITVKLDVTTTTDIVSDLNVVITFSYIDHQNYTKTNANPSEDD